MPPPDNERARPDREARSESRAGGRPDTNRIPPATDTALQAAAWGALSADARGCRCNPDVTVRLDRGVTYVNVAHDDGCPALDRRATA